MKLPRKTGKGQATISWYLSLWNNCEVFLSPFGGNSISPGFVAWVNRDESVMLLGGCWEERCPCPNSGHSFPEEIYSVEFLSPSPGAQCLSVWEVGVYHFRPWWAMHGHFRFFRESIYTGRSCCFLIPLHPWRFILRACLPLGSAAPSQHWGCGMLVLPEGGTLEAQQASYGSWAT